MSKYKKVVHKLSAILAGEPPNQIKAPSPLKVGPSGGRSKLAPETVIIFTTFERPEVAIRSFESLTNALKPVRDRVRLVVCDSSRLADKTVKFRELGADDVIWVPTFACAGTQRNLAVTLVQDKYSAEFICFLEDDFEYTESWYPRLVSTCRQYFGVMSPLGVAYGLFSASTHPLEPERTAMDEEAGLLAYCFGGIADQRFMPMAHYLQVMRTWDADLLGVSYCQTGMQTARNLMRGFCGGIIKENLCSEIPIAESTWRGKRDVGPLAHDLDPSKFQIIATRCREAGVFEIQEKK